MLSFFSFYFSFSNFFDCCCLLVSRATVNSLAYQLRLLLVWELVLVLVFFFFVLLCPVTICFGYFAFCISWYLIRQQQTELMISILMLLSCSILWLLVVEAAAWRVEVNFDFARLWPLSITLYPFTYFNYCLLPFQLCPYVSLFNSLQLHFGLALCGR